MKKVLIVGAGAQGAPCASILARDKDVEEIVLVDIDLDLANKVKNKIKSDKITAIKVDAGKVEDIERAARGADVIINLTLCQFNANIMKAALRSGTHYVDAAFDDPIWTQLTEKRPLEIDSEFKKAGLTGLVGCGGSPGTTNILARHVCDKLDRVDEIHIRIGFKLLEKPEEVELKPTEEFWNRYPILLSGGQRQRVGIGRVLILQPKLVIADEPISMLDVSVRIGILELLLRLRDKFGISFIYITHDLATARYVCDRIAIMYLGKIIEIAPTEDIINKPLHPYTQALVSAAPVPDPTVKMHELPIKGYVPLSPVDVFSSCRFYPRCLHTMKKCREEEPPLVQVGHDHYVACIKARQES